MPWVLSTPDRSSYLCEKCNRFERRVGRIERGAGCLGGGRVCLGAKLVGAGGKLGGCRGRLFGLRVERGALWAERAGRRVFPRAGRTSGQLVACSGWVDIESLSVGGQSERGGRRSTLLFLKIGQLFHFDGWVAQRVDGNFTHRTRKIFRPFSTRTDAKAIGMVKDFETGLEVRLGQAFHGMMTIHGHLP